MHLVHFTPQYNYTNGATMCSAAAILTCFYMLKTNKDAQDVTQENMEFIMQHSSQLYSTFLKTHNAFFHTIEVLKCINIQQRCPELKICEVSGLTSGTPADMCNGICMDLPTLLDKIIDGECCAITLREHTISMGKRGQHTWMSDSLTGVLYSLMDTDNIKEILDIHTNTPVEFSAVIMKLGET